MKDAPEWTAGDVPNLQAIQALVPEIHQMRSKGYDWKAIASDLSGHGVAINVVIAKAICSARRQAELDRRACADAARRLSRGNRSGPA